MYIAHILEIYCMISVPKVGAGRPGPPRRHLKIVAYITILLSMRFNHTKMKLRKLNNPATTLSK